MTFLVGELGSYMTHGIAKKERENTSKCISARNQGLNVKEG